MIPATEIYRVTSQDKLHNLWGPVQKENVWPLIQILARILKWWEWRIKPSVGHCWVWGIWVCTYCLPVKPAFPEKVSVMVSAEYSCLLHSCAPFPGWETFNSWINTRVWSPGPLLPNLGQICKVTSTSKLPVASAEHFIETDSYLKFSLYLIWLLLLQSKFLSTKWSLLHDRDYFDP